MRPDYQIHLPCRVVRLIDGDTLVITAVSGFKWHIRLRDINCPERNTAEGHAAKEFAAEVLDEAADELSVEVALPEDVAREVRKGRSVNPLNAPSFNRLVGDIWVGESDRLTDILVSAGHAERV